MILTPVVAPPHVAVPPPAVMSTVRHPAAGAARTGVTAGTALQVSGAGRLRRERPAGPGLSRWPVGPARRGGRVVEEAQQFHRDRHGDDAAVLLGGPLHHGLPQPPL